MSWKASIGKNLQSIKLLACTTSPKSAIAREWWWTSYSEIKHLNPRFPFMIRPNPEGEPYLLVEYDFARKVKIPVSGMSSDQIDGVLKTAVVEGETMPRAYYQSVAPFRLPSVVE